MPSFYEYTKSAKDVKKFVCEEKCREIALAFDKFNADSGVYEFFGKILLEVAKDHYEMNDESTAIFDLLNEIDDLKKEKNKYKDRYEILKEKIWLGHFGDLEDMIDELDEEDGNN